jgi:hypothetical protein
VGVDSVVEAEAEVEVEVEASQAEGSRAEPAETSPSSGVRQGSMQPSLLLVGAEREEEAAPREFVSADSAISRCRDASFPSRQLCPEPTSFQRSSTLCSQQKWLRAREESRSEESRGSRRPLL